eukprot:s905_g28.t1
MQGSTWVYLLSALICLWMLVLTVTQCTMQARNSRTLRAVVTLLNSVEGQLTSSSMTSSLSLTGMLDSDKIEGTLQCIDAKMLQLSTESQQLRAHVSDLQANDKLSSLDLTMQRVLDLADNATKLMEAWTKEIPPRIKDIYQFTSGLNTTHKAVSVMALDMQKSFSLQETLSDGLLRQGREALQHTQSEQKSQAEKLNELKTDQKAQAEKLGELKVITKVITEELRNSIKQALQKEFTGMAGHTQSSFRGLNVLIPSWKELKDSMNNAIQYLVQANQHDPKMKEDLQTLSESSVNTENRALRLESQVAVLQETLTEVQDTVLQVREAQNLHQEQLQQLLERTPKLPKRTPPPTEAAAPPQTAQGPQQPSHALTLPPESHMRFPPDNSHPIRRREKSLYSATHGSQDALAKRLHRAAAALADLAAVAHDPVKAALQQLLERLEAEAPTVMLLRDALESLANFLAEHQRLPRRGREASAPGKAA